MMAADSGDRFERERRDADRRYNDALTELDRAVVAASAQPALTRDELARLATALIVFLQQITAFVETKDRQLAAETAERDNDIRKALEPITELRAQMSVVLRAVQSLERERRSIAEPRDRPERRTATSAESRQLSGGEPGLGANTDESPALDYKYVAFEDEFRGSEEATTAKLQVYVPIFAGATDVVDLGCGRGELLSTLRAAGVTARGVDANGEMVAIARERGLAVAHGDALGFLRAVKDDSLGGVISTQLIEHLEPAYLVQLLDTASRKLRRGAPILLETINPACWLAFFSSYIRDFTHVRPIHPETLQYLLRASGFERVEIRYSAPVPDQMKMATIDLPVEVLSAGDSVSATLSRLAHAINANAVILNNLMFTHLDYAAVAHRA